MENLFTQIANSDPFTSGAWMLYWFSAIGMVLASWILVRKLKHFAVKSVLMALVVFICFAMAKIEFESGVVLWIPAIPFFGVDFAFQGKKYFEQLLPYLVASGVISLLLCVVTGALGRWLLSFKDNKSPKEQAQGSE
ncbi:hypothetical protein ACFOEK_08650 [Litoribrevibacter euphylliae]|uniref:Uncharacterized protein n=1 Tax=Litoribrevibacter euphylliae TaxID=1834034 RepID=A0ABV7HB46_9GAMM